MKIAITLQGPWRDRIVGLLSLTAAYHASLLSQLCRGRKRPGWRICFETVTRFWRIQLARAVAEGDVPRMRQRMDAVGFRTVLPVPVAVARCETSAISARWFTPPKPKGHILYFQGGGFVLPMRTLSNLIALLAAWTGCRVLAPTYRLAPEHPFPAALDDALAGYAWILEKIPASQLIVGGDSAGGNLALSMLRAARQRGWPMPAGVFCLSPWTDLGNSGQSMAANARLDAIKPGYAERLAGLYLDGHDPRDPDVSPFYADFSGFPPIYLQAGGSEILLDMIKGYAERGRAAGADVTLDIWEHMNHDFQAFGPCMRESEEALYKIARFVERRLRQQ